MNDLKLAKLRSLTSTRMNALSGWVSYRAPHQEALRFFYDNVLRPINRREVTVSPSLYVEATMLTRRARRILPTLPTREKYELAKSQSQPLVKIGAFLDRGIYGISVIGDRRDNQDKIAVFFHRGATYLLVADGVGGRSGGELAARIAVREIEQGIKHDLTIEAAFKRAHVLIKLERRSDPKLAEMSTTATLAMIKNDQATVYSVGDSLAFISRNDPPGLILLNKPQVCSVFGQQVSPPPYRTRDMVNLVLSLARQKSLLRNSLGAEFPFGEKPLTIQLRPQDKLILASDGLKLCWDDLVCICSKSEPINTIVVLLKEESLWQDSDDGRKSDNTSIIGCEYRG